MSGPVILGAGVAGLTLAAELRARGQNPVLVDPNGAPGPHGCSWWAGGMLAPFCEGERAEEPVVRLGQQAARWWAARGVAVTQAGTLVLTMARDGRELEAFARKVPQAARVNADEIAALEPQLEGRFAQGLYLRDEAHLDPRAALAMLAEEAGPILPEAPDTDAPVIACCGLAARDSLPGLRGVRGEMLLIESDEITLTRPVRLLHPRFPLYVVPRGAGRFVLGATQIESADRGPARVRGAVELMQAAYALDPAFAEARIIEIGADARPAFADHLPRIGRQGHHYWINGLFRHGFLLAPSLAQQMADLLMDGKHPELWHEDHG